MYRTIALPPATAWHQRAGQSRPYTPSVAPALTGIVLVVALILVAAASLGLVIGLFRVTRRPPAQ
jgi:hypothetical protein